MNFVFLPSVRRGAVPAGLGLTYLVLLFLLCCAISPVRAAALATDGQTPGMRRSCAAVATLDAPKPDATRAREGQANSFHATSRQPETLHNTQQSAPRSARGVKMLLPSRGSFGVMHAGAVRGSGAGHLFAVLPSAASSAGRILASTAQRTEAGTKVISGVRNLRRISAALPYNTGAAVGHTAAASNIFDQEHQRA